LLDQNTDEKGKRRKENETEERWWKGKKRKERSRSGRRE
jgi:hypothetical protein